MSKRVHVAETKLAGMDPRASSSGVPGALKTDMSMLKQIRQTGHIPTVLHPLRKLCSS